MKHLFTALLLIYGFAAVGQTTFHGKVTDANNQPLPGVNILIQGTTTGTSTDFDGNFSITTEGESPVLEFSMLGFVTKAMHGTSNMAIVLEEDAQDLSEIVVVGTRNPRSTKMESPVAVDVVRIANIKQSAPQTTVNDMLTYLIPSFNSNRQSSAGGSEHIDPASLRGLGPDQVLVLVNGKRRHSTSLVNNQQTVGNGSVGTDLSTIPASAIDRIEVLRDGAAAQYGSDAIAGVINVILKESKGLEASTTFGINADGEGETFNINMNYGLELGDDGFLNLSTEFNDRGSTNTSGNHNLVIYDQSDLGNFFAYDFSNPGARERDNELIAAAGLTRDDFDFQIGDADIQNIQFFANMALPTGEKGEIYASGGASFREGTGFGFRRLPSEGRVLEVYPNGFQPNTNSTITDLSLIGGFKTKLGNDWNMDISNTIGNNSFDYDITNTINQDLGANSPTSFDAGGHAFLQNTVNLDFAKFDTKILSGLGIALGAEMRYENYKITEGEEGSYFGSGSQSFPGYSPDDAVDENRTSIALYADFEFNFTDRFLVAVAGRAEDYSDFGSTINGKIATRYKLSDNLVVRGAFSTGFRAPSLHQRFYNQITTDLVDGLLLEVGTFNNESQLAKDLGIPELKEETSINFSAGLTSRITDNLNLTVDYYNIEIDDRIIYTGSLGNDPFGSPIPELRELFEPFGVATARFFTNAVNTSTNGVDVVLNYQVPMSSNKLDLSLLYNYNKNKVDDELNNVPDLFVEYEDVYFGPQERSLIETNSPEHKAILTLNYTHQSKFGIMLRNTYWGEVTRNGFPFGIEQVHDPKLVTDVTLSYKFNNQLSVLVGASNLFDVYPDDQVYENSYFGVFTYAPVQMGLTGAFYFARLNLKL